MKSPDAKICNNQLLKIILIVFITTFSIFFTHKVLAKTEYQSIVDVFGTQQFSGEEAKKKCGTLFNKMTQLLESPPDSSSEFADKVVAKYQPLIRARLEGKEKFSYFKVTPLRYFGMNDDNVYYTIDVVEQKDAQRLQVFLPKPDKSFADPDGLIGTWKEYENLLMSNYVVKRQKMSPAKCPVVHCLLGFSQPELIKYKDIFMVGAINNKSKLIDMLYHDKDDEERAYSAFILGNLTDPEEVVKIMIPAMNDVSESVRNNVMRVIAAAVLFDKTIDFPIDSAIAGLDYPTAYDRNKAMYILDGLAQQPRYAKYLKEHAAKQLMVQLRMLQPNVHLPAYDILKQISGKNYGERDYTSWQNWLDATLI